MKPATIKAIATAALDRWETIAAAIDPMYQISGDEVVMLNPGRVDRTRKSFSFNRRTGVSCDFATGEKGDADLVGLWARVHGLTQGEAGVQVASLLGLDSSTQEVSPARPIEERALLTPVPSEAEDALPAWRQYVTQHRHAVALWKVCDTEGRLLMMRVRVEPPGQKKDVLPFSWKPATGRWEQGGSFSGTFYGLERLTGDPCASVLIVEGEKTADAAAVLFPDQVALGMMGTGAARRVDLSPLQGRAVIVWPDADKDGINAGRTLSARLHQAGIQVRLVTPPHVLMDWVKPGKDTPGGWDLADVAPEGVDLRAILDSAQAVELGQEVDAESSPNARPQVPGFEWTDQGLCKMRDSGVAEDGTPNPPKLEWIAPLFNLPGLVRDEGSDLWHLLMTWTDPDGAHHEAALPFELLSGDGTELGRMLAQGGMLLSPDAPKRKDLLRYLVGAARRVKARVRLVDALGWQGGAFVLPNGEVIGTTAEPVRYASGARKNARFRPAGTMEGWQQGVARYAVGNPRLAFAIACAFAGPLLELVRPDGGGGFNLMGASSKGKSTCLEAAASVWENPAPLVTWRATGNGVEELAKPRNDGFLALDEMSQVDAKEAGSTAYLLANGSPKARAQKTGGLREMVMWRLVFLSSGEQGLQDVVSEDGGKRPKAGQDVRVPDVPCPPGGMFTTSHEFPEMGLMAERIKAQARKNHGHAIRVFLRELSAAWAQREALETALKEEEATWMRQAIPKGADSQVRRVAGRFALVAVAGELARKMGILPWPEGEASRAALEAFQAWLERRGHHGASETHNAVQALLDFLERHGESRFDDWRPGERPRTVINRAGTRKEAEDHEGWDYYITTSAWKEICIGMNARTVAQACISAGILEPGKAKREGEYTETPYRNERLPLHGRSRVYVSRASGREAFLERETGDA